MQTSANPSCWDMYMVSSLSSFERFICPVRSCMHLFMHSLTHSFNHSITFLPCVPCILIHGSLGEKNKQCFAQDLWCRVGVICGFLAEVQPKLQTLPRARQKASLTGAPRRAGVRICSGGDMLGGMAMTDDVLQASP